MGVSVLFTNKEKVMFLISPNVQMEQSVVMPIPITVVKD